MKRWTKEEEDLILRHRLNGMPPRGILEIIPYRTLSAITTKLNELRNKHNLVYPHGNFRWKDETLLDAVRKYKTTEMLNAYRQPHEPWATTVCRRFGTWTEAVKLAGLEPNKSVLDPYASTILYLIYFVDCDIYKVGLTQKGVLARFDSREDLIELDSITGSLEEVKRMEREFIRILRPYRVKDCPDFLINNGSTECFEGIKVKKLEDIYDLDVD